MSEQNAVGTSQVVDLKSTAPANPTTQASVKVEPTEVDPSQALANQSTDELSPKFAALAKKERFARMLSKKVRSKEMEIMRREQAILERERQWEEEFKTSPLEALKRRNLTYQDITNAALNEGKFQPDVEIKAVKQEIERFRQEQELKEKTEAEARVQQQAQAEAVVIEEFKTQITDHISTGGEKFELSKLYDASELVYQTIDEHFRRTQKVLELDEACTLVEDYLESELDRTSKESKKFRTKYGFAEKKEEEKKSEAKSSVTLSNGMNQSSAPSFLPPKTEEDRIKRALAALG